MAFGKNQPKSVAQITQGLQKMIDDLSVSEVQFEEKQRQNDEEIARRTAENEDIYTEIERNRGVAGKLKELLGVN